MDGVKSCLLPPPLPRGVVAALTDLKAAVDSAIFAISYACPVGAKGKT